MGTVCSIPACDDNKLDDAIRVDRLEKLLCKFNDRLDSLDEKIIKQSPPLCQDTTNCQQDVPVCNNKPGSQQFVPLCDNKPDSQQFVPVPVPVIDNKSNCQQLAATNENVKLESNSLVSSLKCPDVVVPQQLLNATNNVQSTDQTKLTK